jgi:tetratricopeptide (TPR) repeat protein
VHVLKAIQHLGGAVLPRLELDMRLAVVLARNDRLQEALTIVEPHAANARDNSVVLVRLAGFWDAAGDHLRALELREQAIAASQGRGIVEIIDHAYSLARHLRRPDEAEESLKRLDQRELGDFARLFAGITRALIALERERFAEAHGLFTKVEETIALFLANPAMVEVQSYVCAYKALSAAGMGQHEEARALFARARPRMEANRERELLDRWQKAVPTT